MREERARRVAFLENAANHSKGHPEQWERYLCKYARPDGSWALSQEDADALAASGALDASQKAALAEAMDPASPLRARLVRAVSPFDRSQALQGLPSNVRERILGGRR